MVLDHAPSVVSKGESVSCFFQFLPGFGDYFFPCGFVTRTCVYITPVSLPLLWPVLCVCLQISLFLLWRHWSLGLGSPTSLTSKLTSAQTLYTEVLCTRTRSWGWDMPCVGHCLAPGQREMGQAGRGLGQRAHGQLLTCSASRLP